MDSKDGTQSESQIRSNELVQRIARHLEGRRKAIEGSIGSERLAGNKWKEECERCALAEITAMEVWVAQGCRGTGEVSDGGRNNLAKPNTVQTTEDATGADDRRSLDSVVLHFYHCPLDGDPLIEIVVGMLMCRKCETQYIPTQGPAEGESGLSWMQND